MPYKVVSLHRLKTIYMKFEFSYAILKGDDIVFSSKAEFEISDEEVKALEQFIIENNYVWEFVDLPANIFDQCEYIAYDLAKKEYKDFKEHENEYLIVLEEAIPESLVNLFSETTQTMINANMPSEYFEE